MEKKLSSKNKKNRKIERIKEIRIRKLRFLLIVFIFNIVGIFMNVFRIKYVKGDEYERKAIEQQINQGGLDQVLNPNRGSIIDRNGQTLATSTTVYNVIFDIRRLVEQFNNNIENEKKREEEKNKVINTLKITSEVLEIPLDTLWSYLKIDDETKKPVIDKHYYVIAKKISKAKASELMSKISSKNVWLEDDSLRTYSHNSKASQLVGFIRGNNSSWGLERYYNNYLTGTTGRLFRLYNENNCPITERIEPEQGYTLVTTIDSTIQQYASEISTKYGKLYNAEHACIIVMVPKTGEILAIGEYPTFNANDPFNVDYITSDILREKLNNFTEENRMEEFFKIWKNFSISDTFEPGSILKPLVVAAALEEGIISENDNFYCSGSIDIADAKIRCSNRSGHGKQTLIESLANSCNISIIEIAKKLGREKFYEYQKNFGIGELTDIDLYGETSASSLVYKLSQLNPVELATSSMGQGFNVTAIQAINSFNSIINGGNLMKPYIVSQIVDSKGNVIKENTPTIQRKVISQDTSNFLKKALVSVVMPGGTGRKAYISGYSIGGKTGTAQQGNRNNKEYTLSFISYLPAEDPEYIALGVLHKCDYKSGVTSAVPMLRDLFVNLIKYKSIPPSRVNEEVESNINIGNIYLEDYTGKNISKVIYDLNRKNINYEIIGSGSIVTKQTPSCGKKISTGSKIYIYISGEEKELTIIPNIIGMTKTQAIEILKSSNLLYLIEENNSINSDNNKDKIVSFQIPSSGIRIEKGTEVKFVLE